MSVLKVLALMLIVDWSVPLKVTPFASRAETVGAVIFNAPPVWLKLPLKRAVFDAVIFTSLFEFTVSN